MSKNQNLLSYIYNKKVLNDISDKEIYFQGSKKYCAKLLLENTTLIKCSYLSFDDQNQPYIVKVFSFEEKSELEEFVHKINDLQNLKSPHLACIHEIYSDKKTLQAILVEDFLPGISLKMLLDECGLDNKFMKMV